MSLSCVSVVIPVFNGAAFIQEALESVLRQTHQDLEVIVVDDGSTDRTRQTVQPYVVRCDGRVRYIFQDHQGLSAARNTGCRLARGRYVAFLDADDVWKPKKLAAQLPVLNADEAVGLVSSMAEVIDARGHVLGLKPNRPPGRTLAELVTQGCAPPSTFVVRREALESVGYFDPQITQGIEDLDLCLRLIHRWKMAHVGVALIQYRQHDANLSAKLEGTCRGYIRTFEKLLAAADGVPRRAARQRLAKYRYLLGKTYVARGEFRRAFAELAAALRLSPVVGLQIADERQRGWRRGVAVLKPFLAVCGVGALALARRDGVSR